jgi:cation diffusion facilitator CzcD-associated flavoprotein CzcO
LWFQQCQVPWVETVDVEHLDRQGDRSSSLDGGRCEADRVVMATGLSGLARFLGIEIALARLVTHSLDLQFRCIQGPHVAVVGAGQSAL